MWVLRFFIYNSVLHKGHVVLLALDWTTLLRLMAWSGVEATYAVAIWEAAEVTGYAEEATVEAEEETVAAGGETVDRLHYSSIVV